MFQNGTKCIEQFSVIKKTEYGQPSAYLIDVEDYEIMQNRMKILEGLSRGESAILEGNIYSQTQAKEKLNKWLNK